MSITELNTQKISLVKEILDETNENFITELVAYIHRAKTQAYPCCFTDAEKRQRIAQSVADAKAGLGVSQDTMINRHPQWK
ncbi:MAG: hypothetical protein LBU22_01075 [Dysgonamonadaceae bacterium]|jgi:hypothetical protein|nr:hypothetical protein [Dysgonamonadaceae bacterium]